MRTQGNTTSGDGSQDVNQEEELQFETEETFIGEAGADDRTVDTVLRIKILSPGYCGMMAERAKIAGKRVLLGRMGGVMMGVADLVRNPEEVAKGGKPDIGTALVGDFNADVYDENGEVREFAGGMLYLPGGFQEGELSKFARLSEEDQAKGHLFSYFIAAEPATNMRGYRYVLGNALRVRVDQQALIQRMKREAQLIAQGAIGNPLLEAPRQGGAHR